MTSRHERSVRFERLAEIAAGQTATVDLCRLLDTERAGRLLAVKRLLPHLANDTDVSSRFLDEVWMSAALNHPNVVSVVGWGTDDDGDYLACELVQGVSLARLMKTVFDTGEAFTERLVVYIGLCLCRGLAAAHALTGPDGALLHLVHRDLSPGNVLVGFNGDIKITDFGIAKAKQRLATATVEISQRASPHLAPEEARGHSADHRADLFALGVLLFELLAGRPPWRGTSHVDRMARMVRDPPADLNQLRPKMDKNLIPIVLACLEKEPANRYQSADAIASELDAWLYAHGYQDGNPEALSRFVRRNAMRQMRWFERAVAGQPQPQPAPKLPVPPPSFGGRKQGAQRDAATAVDLRPGSTDTRSSIRDEPTSDERQRPSPSHGPPSSRRPGGTQPPPRPPRPGRAPAPPPSTTLRAGARVRQPAKAPDLASTVRDESSHDVPTRIRRDADDAALNRHDTVRDLQAVTDDASPEAMGIPSIMIEDSDDGESDAETIAIKKSDLPWLTDKNAGRIDARPDAIHRRRRTSSPPAPSVNRPSSPRRSSRPPPRPAPRLGKDLAPVRPPEQVAIRHDQAQLTRDIDLELMRLRARAEQRADDERRANEAESQARSELQRAQLALDEAADEARRAVDAAKSSREAVRLVEEAQRLLQQGDAAEAAKLLERAQALGSRKHPSR